MTSLRPHTIFAGQFVITTVPSLITTVLGSCVTVCLWDKETHMAGMNHYLLPECANPGCTDPNRGSSSVRMLVKGLLNRKVRPESIEAKIFGGCNSLYKERDIFRVGERNVEVAYEVLREFGISVAAAHTGGHFGRKIVFNSATGKVRMRLLSKTITKVDEEISKGFGY